MAQKNEITKKPTTELADASLFTGQGESGFEGTSAETFKTPFLKVLQALSPELKRNDPKYLQGALAGQLYNTATNTAVDTIDVIVLKVSHSLIAWRPDRGGFAGHYPKAQEDKVVVHRDGMKKLDAEGNDVMDTLEFFCMDIKQPSNVFILALSSASFKHGRSFATRLRTLQANGKPTNVSWAGIWQISTVEETKDSNSWYTIGNTPTFVRFVTKEERDNLILPAQEMLKQAQTDYSSMRETESQDSASSSVQY